MHDDFTGSTGTRSGRARNGVGFEVQETVKHEAVRLIGKGYSIGESKYSVLGKAENGYQIFVRAIEENKLVFILVTGPDNNKCAQILEYMKKNGAW